jgi:single-strand DNA-binding protein
MNLVCLKGNLGSDPEIKSFDWGKVAKFSLATSETYKNKAGEKVTDTTWHNIVFKGAMCDVLEKYFKKGDQILVTGKIVTRTYKDKNQVDHWTTEIICDKFEFCGKSERPVEKPDNKVDSKSQTSDINDLPGAIDDNEMPF